MSRAVRPIRGVSVADSDELREDVQPLTSEEVRWLNRLQRVLRDCPVRLELATGGDPMLIVIDGPIVSAGCVEICDGHARRNGVQLGEVAGGPKIAAITWWPTPPSPPPVLYSPREPLRRTGLADIAGPRWSARRNRRRPAPPLIPVGGRGPGVCG